MDYQSLKNRSIGVNGEVRSSRRRLSDSERQSQEEVAALESLRESYSVQSRSVELLKKIIEDKSAEHLTRLTKLLTLALKTIFPDRDYSVEIDIDDKRGANTAEFSLVERLSDGSSLKASLSGEVGGSIRAVVGFTLQLFYIRYFNLSPILFVDEALSSLSEEYVPNIIEFMRKFSEKRGFVFVIISHDPRFSPFADTVYRIEGGAAVREKQGSFYA